VTSSPLDSLLTSQSALWRGRDRYQQQAAMPTGFASLDSALPMRGWNIGAVTELLVAQSGIGEFSLLLPALQQITSNGQWAALVNPPHTPYAPALANANIQLDRLLIINSDTDTNTLWATEHVLRSGLFAIVMSWINRTTAQKQRRLQLAAEAGNTIAVAYRPGHDHRTHSPAAVRISISLAGGLLSLDVLKAKGGQPQTLCLNPADFDQSQGVEWPAVANQPTLAAIAPSAGSGQ